METHLFNYDEFSSREAAENEFEFSGNFCFRLNRSRVLLFDYEKP